ncbi:MAG: imidazole glycerol phosphate synthase subunit HisH [Spirochaetales bacterium]|nr:imidazole glycerol phosphate synthase subunit HisH [Spirochaetales bacterium]
MKKQTIGVVDYDAGNLRSVETALEYLNSDYIVSSDPETLNKTDKIIFPGVGDAGAAMGVLKLRGLDDFLKGWTTRGNFLLGICIGCQLLFEHSDERDTDCLGILSGNIPLFPADQRDETGQRFKVPHMGWNQVKQVGNHPLFKGIPDGASFYFVHSYYPSPAEKGDVIGQTEYMLKFDSAVARDNVMATQFHPEKSGEHGLKMIQNYIEL